MERQLLERLITQPESASLDFKRDMPKIYDDNGDVKSRHKDELCRDILSLANGNTTSAGEDAYLVIGVAEDMGLDGGRLISGVAGKIPLANDLLSIVKGVSDPPIEHLSCDVIELNGTPVLAITIFSSPHLHETTRPLRTPKTEYSERVVFIRRGSSIGIATAKERAAFQDLKKFRLGETKKMNPVWIGLITGSIVSAGIASGVITILDQSVAMRDALVLVCTVAGGVIGTLIGASCSNLLEFFRDTRAISPQWRLIVRVTIISFMIVLAVLALLLVNMMR